MIMDKRIKMTEKEMCNYFIKEQKIMEYAQDFFKDICACSIITNTCFFVRDTVLPLSCYNQMDEYLYAVEHELDYAIQGGFVSACKKQAYIRIGIDTTSSILTKRLKQTIRHEIIHYYLWVLDLPHDDDSLEFWCMCYIYEAGAYQELSPEDQEYYELFTRIYDTYVADLQWNVKHLLIGQMVTNIQKMTIDKYEDSIIKTVNDLKKMYDIK